MSAQPRVCPNPYSGSDASAMLDVALAFVLLPGTGHVTCEDRGRRKMRDGLGDLPYSMWITASQPAVTDSASHLHRAEL